MIVFFLSAALCALMLVGCGTEDVPPSSTDQVLQTEHTETMETTGEEEIFTEPVNPDEVRVSTEFGNLYFREQWVEFMHTEQVKNENSIVVTFEADVNGVLYPLFSVTIGEGQGDPVGQLTDSAGTKRDVYVHVEEIVESDSLTAGEQNRMYAMQEEINYIIESLK